MLRPVLGLAVVALLAGCAHAVKLPLTNVALPALAAAPPPSRDQAIARVQSAKPCCKTWNQLPFENPLPDEPKDYLFDANSPVADLDGQRTHFLAFVLPGFNEPYRVLFKAEPSARHLQSSYLFAPTVTVLDAQFHPLRSEDVKLCEYIGWRPAQSGAFGSFTVDDRAAKYLVITTSSAQLKASTYWEQSPAGFTSDVFSPPASSGNFSIPHGPDGPLSVGLLTPQYRKAVDDAICGKPKSGSGLLSQMQHSLTHPFR
jgi:maltose operon protein